jgi:hypothetical protein
MDGKTQLPHRGPRGKGGSMGNELVSFLSSITFETIGVGDFASLPGARIASTLIEYFFGFTILVLLCSAVVREGQDSAVLNQNQEWALS